MFYCIDERLWCTSLLGHENHLYVGMSSGNVKVYDSQAGHFLQQFSLHSSDVDALLKLPPEIKECICGESRKIQKKAHISLLDLPSKLQKQRRLSGHSLCQLKDHQSGMCSMLVQPFLINTPLIVSLGNNLADYLGIGRKNSEKRVEFLTWTGHQT